MAGLSVCQVVHVSVCHSPVEDTSLVHVIHSLDELVHVPSYPLFSHVMTAPPYELIDVHVHELKYQRQPPSRLVTADSRHFSLCSRGCNIKRYSQLYDDAQATMQ